MSRLTDLFSRALLLLNSIGTVWIFILMIVIVTDVIGRTVFTRPLPGVPELVSLSLGLALFVALYQACLPLFLRAWTNGDYVGVEGYITYPIWPVRLFMLIGCVGAAIQYALFATSDFARMFKR
jgi:hypothetical protein